MSGLRVTQSAVLAVHVALYTASCCGRAQELNLGDDARHAAAKAGHVLLLSDSFTLSAGKAQSIELRFRVDPGFHINSHKPADELMIPTSLQLEASPKLNVLDTHFPAGSPFRLQIAGGDLLDVYQGEFRVTLRLAPLPASQMTLNGTLRYQACDNAACFPPRNLPVRVMLTVK